MTEYFAAHIDELDEQTTDNIYRAMAAAVFGLKTREEADAVLAETKTDPAELGRVIRDFDSMLPGGKKG